MNKKGQATVIFILLVPIFLVIIALLVDMGINTYNDKKLKNVTDDVLSILIKDKRLSELNLENEKKIIEKMKEIASRIYEENKIETENIYIEIESNNIIKIINSTTHYSFMNSLMNKGNGKRNVSIEAKVYIEDNEVVIEYKGEDYEN